MKPLVSIICLTYNQEDYITQALEGFLMQKTNFTFEVLVHDDSSDDGTLAILEEYQKKYPAVIKPVYEKENQYSKRNFSFVTSLFKSAKGKYIAMCEGDDFWTDPTKLQRQVDFLEQHQDYALVFHPVRIKFEDDQQQEEIFPGIKSEFTVKRLLQGNFIQTNSVMYRAHGDYQDMAADVIPGDWYVHLYHAKYGKIGFINRTMAVYRRHRNGIWQDAQSGRGEFWRKNGLLYLYMFIEVKKLFRNNKKRVKIIDGSIIAMFNRLLQVDIDYGDNLLSQAARRYPEDVEFFVMKQNEALRNNSREIDTKELAIQNLSIALSRSIEESKKHLLSKSYRFGYAALHPWRIPHMTVSALKKTRASLRENNLNRQDIVAANRVYQKVEKSLARKNVGSGKSLAVVLHLYYIDMWPYFREKLSRLNGELFDLYISVPIGKRKEVESEVLETYPKVSVYEVPNRGRDVLPFLMTMKSIRDKRYDAILKLHSKKSLHRTDGSEWLDTIIDQLLPVSSASMKFLIEALASKSNAQIGPDSEYVSLAVNYEANKKKLKQVLSKTIPAKEIKKIDDDRFKYGFFAGTMFWVDPRTLESLIGREFNVASFDLEKGQIDNTYAHAIERVFSLLPELSNKKISGSDGKTIKEVEYNSGVIPEWSDLHINKIVKR